VITANGAAQRGNGTVVAVGPGLGQQTGTMPVRIRPTGGTFIPGAATRAAIVVRNLTGAFVVPASAVVKDPDTGATVVYVAEGQGRYRRVPVRVLLQSGDRMAIAGDNLHAGQVVVTRGGYELTTGD
jgi:multidrug efflux pump subunit AcrA (membrane-fusion protein)